MDDDENNVYVDTNYKHYETTARRTDKRLQLKSFESPTKEPPLPERKYINICMNHSKKNYKRQSRKKIM